MRQPQRPRNLGGSEWEKEQTAARLRAEAREDAEAAFEGDERDGAAPDEDPANEAHDDAAAQDQTPVAVRRSVSRWIALRRGPHDDSQSGESGRGESGRGGSRRGRAGLLRRKATGSELLSQRATDEVLVEEGVAAGALDSGSTRDELGSKRGGPVHLEERIAERERARRITVVRRVLIAVAALAAVLAVAWVIFFSPLFAVRGSQIDPSGVQQNATLTRAQVAERLAPAVGTPLPRLNTGALQRDIAAHFPQLTNIQVSRHPLHGLAVSAELRKPVGCVVKGADCQPIDETGSRFPVPADQAGTLTHIELADGGQDGPGLTEFVKVLASIDPSLRAQVRSVRIGEAARIELNLDGGKRVIWGDSSRPKLKGQVLGVLLKQAPGTVYDISEPTAPTVR